MNASESWALCHVNFPVHIFSVYALFDNAASEILFFFICTNTGYVAIRKLANLIDFRFLHVRVQKKNIFVFKIWEVLENTLLLVWKHFNFIKQKQKQNEILLIKLHKMPFLVFLLKDDIFRNQHFLEKIPSQKLLFPISWRFDWSFSPYQD